MKIGAIILAGGKSSRMGTDKGLLLLNGKSMVAYVLDTLKQITDDIIIISNNAAYEVYKVPVYEDLIKDAGPLAGTYTGLIYSKHDKNIVVSCDAPFISVELLNLLIEKRKNYDATIATHFNKTHPIIGIYDKKCVPTFKNELEQNQRKIKIALEKVNLQLIAVNQFDKKVFTNVNTPIELKEIQ
ncbi:MAG: hypothetical protein A3K10_07320 [Bacteroidetes bacterium RIFCSPLOWO2_12_FULL_31_6]|nr:MAG: hypothetical protein A3K10_07320 [Bacteroidetes bacterium RIFCSPLOWO2_12_FULL_31_6]